MPPIPPDLARAIDALDPAVPLLVALDFDGTLAHLVPEPGRARPVAGVLGQLEALAGAPATEVVIISGRALHDLARVSGARDLAVLIGSHGQEHGSADPLTGGEAALLGDLRSAAGRIVADAPGAWVEDKPAGFAVHVRACAPPDADVVLERARELAAAAAGVHAIEGKMILELSVRPLDKGSALRAMVEQRGGLALFAGDDVTDETAMQALREQDITIKVGAGTTVARHRVEDPTDMVEVLAAVVRARVRRA